MAKNNNTERDRDATEQRMLKAVGEMIRRDANGGLLLNPELGVQYALRCGVHLFFAAGYELQRLERLRKYEGCWFSAEFAEQLSHGTLLLKVGVLF